MRLLHIRITKDNIDKEHICCAMSNKQSVAKKEWLKQRFEEGLVGISERRKRQVLYRIYCRQNAWVPIEAGGYLYINCLWIAAASKGTGIPMHLLDECMRDAKAQGKKEDFVFFLRKEESGSSCPTRSILLIKDS